MSQVGLKGCVHKTSQKRADNVRFCVCGQDKNVLGHRVRIRDGRLAERLLMGEELALGSNVLNRWSY